MKQKTFFIILISLVIFFFSSIYSKAETVKIQEINSLRTLNRKVYKKSNNKYDISYFGIPVHYWNGNGYEEFDLSFEETSQSISTSNSNYSLFISKDFISNPNIQLDYLGNYPICISLNQQNLIHRKQQSFNIEEYTPNQALITAKGGKIHYENEDLEYLIYQYPSETRISTEIESTLIKNQYYLYFNINYTDLIAEKENSDIVFYNKQNMPIYRIGKLFAETSNGETLVSKSLDLTEDNKKLKVLFDSPKILNNSTQMLKTTLVLENELNKGIDYIRDKTITVGSSEVTDTDILMAGIDPLPSIDENGKLVNLERRSIIELNLPYYYASEVERAIFSLTKTSTSTSYHSNPNIHLYQILNKDFDSIQGTSSYTKSSVAYQESSSALHYDFNLTEVVKKNIEEKRSILLALEGQPVTGSKVGCAKFIATNQIHGAIPTFTITLSEELGATLYGAATEYVATQSTSFNCFSYALNLNEGFLNLGWENGNKPTSIKEDDYQTIFIPAAIAAMNKKKIEVRILKGGISDPIFAFERRICFRVGSFKRGVYDDFHFMKQHNDGRWSHKPGSLPSVLLDYGQTPDTVLWHSVDVDLYDSPITYFSIC